MKKSREEFMTGLRAFLGDDTSDEALALIEDAEDSFTTGDDWEQKYKDNDAQWRKKYRDRFFSASKDESSDDDDTEPETDKTTYESLFKEGK